MPITTPQFTIPLTVTNPWVLLLLPLLIAGAVLISRARPNNLPRRLARLSLGLRLLIVTLLVLSLAGLRVATPGSDLAVVFLVDQSDSVSPEVQGAAREWVRAMAWTSGRAR